MLVMQGKQMKFSKYIKLCWLRITERNFQAFQGLYEPCIQHNGRASKTSLQLHIKDHLYQRHPWLNVKRCPWLVLLTNIWSILHQHFTWHGVSQLIFNQCIWVGWHSVSNQPTIDQVSMEMSSEMLIKGIDLECRSTVNSRSFSTHDPH